MAYIGSSPTKVVSRQSANIFTYTATANQTAFTGADDNGNTLACSPSDIMVHMNGIKLEESDYTATTTTVTLVSGAAAGDEVTITAFLTFESADHYTKSAADTRYVNASGDTMSGALTNSAQLRLHDSSLASSAKTPELIFGDEYDNGSEKAIFKEGQFLKIQGHPNEGIILQTSNLGTVQEVARFYGSSNANHGTEIGTHGGKIKMFGHDSYQMIQHQRNHITSSSTSLAANSGWSNVGSAISFTPKVSGSLVRVEHGVQTWWGSDVDGNGDIAIRFLLNGSAIWNNTRATGNFDQHSRRQHLYVLSTFYFTSSSTNAHTIQFQGQTGSSVGNSNFNFYHTGDECNQFIFTEYAS